VWPRVRGQPSVREPFDFQLAATELIGAEVELFTDEVLRNEHLRPEPKGPKPLGARTVRLSTGIRLLAQSASVPVA
jgi:hypothetical protein